MFPDFRGVENIFWPFLVSRNIFVGLVQMSVVRTDVEERQVRAKRVSGEVLLVVFEMTLQVDETRGHWSIVRLHHSTERLGRVTTNDGSTFRNEVDDLRRREVPKKRRRWATNFTLTFGAVGLTVCWRFFEACWHFFDEKDRVREMRENKRVSDEDVDHFEDLLEDMLRRAKGVRMHSDNINGNLRGLCWLFETIIK